MWVVYVAIVGVVAMLFMAIADGSVGYMPPVEQLENPIDKYASQVISADGKALGSYAHSKDNRFYVKYEDLSPDLVRALIATEDVRFAEHSGIDVLGLFRAVVKRGILMQKSGGGGSTITQQLKAQEEANKKANETSGTNTPVTPGSTQVTGSFVWPSANSTYVTSKYGYRVHPIFGTKKFHSGIDIGAAAGTNVLAADGGTVSVATYSSSYGNYVMIYHPDGTSTTYAHMSSLAVSAGQTVNQGDVVGYVGSTGNSTGNHCHFEVRYNGVARNPLNYL